MTTPDANMTTLDANMTTLDANMTTPDANTTTPDATMTTPDATMTTPDATMTTPDATMTTPDANMTTPDANTSTDVPLANRTSTSEPGVTNRQSTPKSRPTSPPGSASNTDSKGLDKKTVIIAVPVAIAGVLLLVLVALLVARYWRKARGNRYNVAGYVYDDTTANDTSAYVNHSYNGKLSSSNSMNLESFSSDYNQNNSNSAGTYKVIAV
ncbi:hypothetical protein EB796_000362 [Bugula neritina]|nr:hypothetical protein EB796_000362 [Bugula neritina]